MKVRLNLATSPLENNRRFLLGAGLLGTAALLLLVFLSTYTFGVWRANREYRAEVARLRAEMDALRSERAGLDKFFKGRDAIQVMDRATLLNSLIQQRSFPWTRIFMDLEQLLPAGVRVVSLSPRMQDGNVQVQIVIGAINDDLKEKVVRSFEESGQFRNVQLLGETRPNRAGEADRVQFNLVANYVAEGR